MFEIPRPRSCDGPMSTSLARLLKKRGPLDSSRLKTSHQVFDMVRSPSANPKGRKIGLFLAELDCLSVGISLGSLSVF